MYKTEEFISILERFAPLSISRSAIEKGDYDNSGLLVKCGDGVNKILFSLDLSSLAVKEAEKFGADTIVTHHPAIYNPIKSLSLSGENASLLSAIKAGINVISMHLNLDMANFGVDESLADALGGKDCKILDDLDGTHGYGREFYAGTSAEEITENAKKVLGTEKIILYGGGKIEKVASFCGGGANQALACVKRGIATADLIVSSDVPHHVLAELIERKKAVMIIPHYAAEQYGFNKFYEWAKAEIGENARAEYFLDKRFM